MASTRNDPLRVTFDLLTPLITPQHPIHLDALLCGVLELRAQADRRTVGDEVERLPLKEHPAGCWMASALEFDVVERSMRFQVRRTDVETLVRHVVDGTVKHRADNLVYESGVFRNYLMSLPTLHAKRATAWCIGDQNEVAAMLSELPSIGRQGRNGFGMLAAEPRVVIDPAAETLWKRRVLPFAEPQAEPVMATVRYPYFDRTRQKQAWMPQDLLGSLS